MDTNKFILTLIPYKDLLIAILQCMKTFLDHLSFACVQCLGGAANNQRYEIAIIPKETS